MTNFSLRPEQNDTPPNRFAVGNNRLSLRNSVGKPVGDDVIFRFQAGYRSPIDMTARDFPTIFEIADRIRNQRFPSAVRQYGPPGTVGRSNRHSSDTPGVGAGHDINNDMT